MRAIIVLFATSLSAAEPLTFPSTPPTEAKDASKTFHVLDGFEMQLIAAEPLVTDPVAITYDEDGRAYVCEMNDYPYTDKSTHKPSQENPTDANIGKVRLLTDTDGDGVFDKASVFAEGLSWPTGPACWKGGIFVTATPDVWYLKDTNGDGVADVRKKVFTGLKKLNVQAVMNNPIWGLDHRIYIAGGTNGGEIRRAEGSEDVMPLPKDSKPLPIKRNDFSFDPSTGDVRLESGGARFGNTFDDWGNRFLCNIRNPCQHVVIPHRYLERNPYVSIASPLNDCAEAGDQLPVYRTSPVEPWRDFRAQRWSSEGSHLPKSELVGAGVVTSSAGITVYRGDAYPPEYRDFAFVADVAGNLFYRMKLVPDGVTFKAVQVDGTKNFCTSDDVWFRPVNFTNAPDGCLHVCDMYREVIEHPWSIPDDIHEGLDLLKGRDRGRVYRLKPKGFKSRHPAMLSQATTAELVALLDHANGWHRETAQRLLFEREDADALPALRTMLTEAKTAQGRIHALWSLEAAGAIGKASTVDFRAAGRLSETSQPKDKKAWLADAGVSQSGYALLLQAAQDKDAKVRQQAVRMRPEALIAPREVAELYKLRTDADKLLRDASIMVQIETLMAHSLVFSPAALPRFGEVCIEHDQQAQIFQSALLGCAESSFPMFETVLKSPKLTQSPALQSFQVDLAGMIGRAFKKGDPDAPYHVMHHLVLRGAPDAFSRRVVQSLASSLRRGASSLDEAALKDLKDAESRAWMDKLRSDTLAELGDAKLPAESRIVALGLLPDLMQASDALPQLTGFLAATQPAELQLAALDALNTYREPAVADIIVGAWKSFTPALRDKAQLVLLSRAERIPVLLAALESGAIPKTQVSAASRATLGRNKNADIFARVAKLFGDSSNPNRKAVIDKYQAALTTKGDATRGAKVYELACMACHRHRSRGIDVGPHLATVKAWTPEQLLTNILDPNREVSPNFALYIIETKDGRTLSGLVMSETAGNVVLKRADGGQESLLRSDIQSISSTGTSLMPEGVEAAITPEQMADLIEFLRQ
jgi:putative membrane-bound dehydrogenase-like protein